MEEGGSPAFTAAPPTDEAYVWPILLLMMVFRTADPRAPPSALAENASPVAVESISGGEAN